MDIRSECSSIGCTQRGKHPIVMTDFEVSVWKLYYFGPCQIVTAAIAVLVRSLTCAEIHCQLLTQPVGLLLALVR